MLDRLIFRTIYNGLDVFLDGIAVYQRLCELDAGLFEVRAGAGHAVERLAQAAFSPTNIALHG